MNGLLIGALLAAVLLAPASAAEITGNWLTEEGKATVIAPASEFKPLAESQLDGRQMASPAVSGKALFIRTDRHLYRIEQR